MLKTPCKTVWAISPSAVWKTIAQCGAQAVYDLSHVVDQSATSLLTL